MEPPEGHNHPLKSKVCTWAVRWMKDFHSIEAIACAWQKGKGKTRVQYCFWIQFTVSAELHFVVLDAICFFHQLQFGRCPLVWIPRGLHKLQYVREDALGWLRFLAQLDAGAVLFYLNGGPNQAQKRTCSQYKGNRYKGKMYLYKYKYNIYIYIYIKKKTI